MEMPTMQDKRKCAVVDLREKALQLTSYTPTNSPFPNKQCGICILFSSQPESQARGPSRKASFLPGGERSTAMKASTCAAAKTMEFEEPAKSLVQYGSKEATPAFLVR